MSEDTTTTQIVIPGVPASVRQVLQRQADKEYRTLAAYIRLLLAKKAIELTAGTKSRKTNSSAVQIIE